MRSHAWGRFLSAAALVLAALAPVQARAAGYRLSDLGTLPGGGPSGAYGLSPSGLVVGVANNAAGVGRAVSFGVPVRDLGSLAPAGFSRALGVNDAGTAVGWAQTAAGGNHAAIFLGGSVADLGVLPGGFGSQAKAINRGGLVVGGGDAAGGGSRGFYYQIGQSAKIVPLATLGGPNNSAAAVSDGGTIVGSCDAASGARHACAWANGVVADLGTLAPANPAAFSEATGVSSDGRCITGNSANAAGQIHAFLLRDGAMTDLGGIAGGPVTVAVGVNASGLVVGNYGTTYSKSRKPFVSVNGGPLQDLAAQVVNGAGWTLITATAVNDRGQILVQGSVGGANHGVLLTPQ